MQRNKQNSWKVIDSKKRLGAKKAQNVKLNDTTLAHLLQEAPLGIENVVSGHKVGLGYV